MARLPALIEAIARHDRRGQATIAHIARQVRDEGLIRSSKRGVGAAIMTVKDAAINSAKTREEAAAALDEVVPFIEIPDMALTKGLAPTGLLMAAYGVMPWRGVEGTGVKIADLADPVADLAGLTVDLKEGGKTVAEGKGEMLLGHPLDVVLWLVGQGVTLAPGDAISLGSLSALTPAKPGQSLSADYSVGGKTMHVAATLTE